jgi:hypothetical protein
MLHVRGTREVYKEFWWGNLREIHHWEDLGEDGTILFKWIISRKIGAGTELICLRTWTSSEFL